MKKQRLLSAIILLILSAGLSLYAQERSEQKGILLDGAPGRPVELIYFYGNPDQDSIVLYWGTATEITNFGFEIQQAFPDTSEWNPIGFVLGAGTTYSPRDYVFTDTTVADSGIYFYRLKQIDTNGDFKYSWTITVPYLITGVEIAERPPSEFVLYQNYPNPFNPLTVISFELNSNSRVVLSVFDTKGELVEVLSDGTFDAGRHEIYFDGSDLASGVYFYKIVTNTVSASKKMLIMK